MISLKNTFIKPNATIKLIWHPLIKEQEHGKEYFKVKSLLPEPSSNIKKTARALNTDSFNTAHAHASSQATTAAAAAPTQPSSIDKGCRTLPYIDPAAKK
jgi:hypothetical protein